MARAPRPARRPPLTLLALLALAWASPGAGTGVIVQAPTQVRGYLGESVTLPCHLQPLDSGGQVTQVTWTRQGAGGVRSIAVFHPTRGPTFPEPGRMEFVAAKPGANLQDASLAVSELRAEDEGNYTCQIATFPLGMGIAGTWLQVLAQPQNTAEALEVPLSPLTSNFVPVASCVSTRGRPPARVTWSPQLGGTANKNQVPGPLPGTFTVTSLLTLVPSSQVDGQNVTCQVEHDSLEEPVLLPVTLAVHYPPEVSISGYDDNWYLGRREVTLTCDVRSNPEPTGYDWSTTEGPLPPGADAQGARLLIHTVDESINTTLICRVTNALGSSQTEVSILVREEPLGNHSDAGLSATYIAIIIIVILVILGAVGALVHFKPFKHCGRHSPSANGDVHYSAIHVHVSSPQDTATSSTR